MNIAVVEIAGKQFKVRENDEFEVPKLGEAVGASLTFDRVLLVNDENKTKVGGPTVKSASVKATVLQHGKYDKIIVYKKKRRIGYKKKQGHRQDFTVIKVDEVVHNKT